MPLKQKEAVPTRKMSDPVIATFEKPTQDTRVGLKLGPAEEGGVQITRMSKKGGIFSNSEFRPGMLLVKINSRDCSQKTASEVKAILKGVIGPLTIEAAWPDYSSSGSDSSLDSESESEHKTERSVGDVGKSTSVMVGTFEDSKPEASEGGNNDNNNDELQDTEIEVRDDGNIHDNDAHHNEKSNVPRTFTAVAFKNMKDHKVGVRLIRDKKEKDILIAHIAETSLFVGSDILPGMRVLSINDVSTEEKSVREMSTVIAKAEREVKIRACEHNEASVVTSSTGGDNVSAVASAVSANSESSGGVTAIKARKASPSQKAGIRLHKVENQLLVHSVADTSIFLGTALTAGVPILAINGVESHNKSVKEMSTVIAAAEGELVIAVPRAAIAPPQPSAGDRQDSITVSGPDSSTDSDPDIIVVTARKPSTSSKAGIRLKKDPSTGTIFVEKINDTSIFVETALAVGMPVLSINGVGTSGKSIHDMSLIISQASGDVKIKGTKSRSPAVVPLQPSAEDSQGSITVGNPESSTDSDPDVIVVTARKPSTSSKVGIRLKNDQSTGMTFIEKINDTSIFFGTALAVGMPVLSINGVGTTGKSIKDLSYIISQASGDVKVKATGSHSAHLVPTPAPPAEEVPLDDVAPPPSVAPFESAAPVVTAAPAGAPPNSITVTITKMVKDQKTGIRMSRGDNEAMVITKISPESSFRGYLEVGWFVSSINGVGSEGMKVREFTNLIADAVGPVAIVASSDNPAVYAAQQQAGLHRSDPEIVHHRIEPTDIPQGAYLLEAMKSSRDAKVGLKLRRSKENASVVVVKEVTDTSLFKGKLFPGMHVISINGHKANENSVKVLSHVVGDAEDRVSIVVMDAEEAMPPVLPAYTENDMPVAVPAFDGQPRSRVIDSNTFEYTVFKQDKTSKLGIKIKDDPRDRSKIMVTSVSSNGLFGQTTARAGLYITEMDGQSCAAINAHDLLNRLANTTGTVTLRMETRY